MAIAIVGLIGVGSLVIDLGMGLVAKSELQNASDSATLAGAHEIGKIYDQHPERVWAELDEGDLTKIRTAARNYMGFNKAGGKSLDVPDTDLKIGRYDPATGAFTETNEAVRMVKVTSRRDDTANGAMPTQLATVLAINQMTVQATTGAALTPISKLKGGQGDFPIGIAKTWFDSNQCGQESEEIVLFPTSGDSCAGWHSYDVSPANASRLRNIVDGLKDDTYSAPETIAGETYYNFIGGTVESACSNLKELQEAKRVGSKMLAHVPVYDYDCGNVMGPRLILGFVNVEISNVQCGAVKKLDVKVVCGVVGNDVGEAGGGAHDYGLLAKSPKMVY